MRKAAFLVFALLAWLVHDRALGQFEGPGWGIVVNQIGLYNAMDTLRRNHETIFGREVEKSLSPPKLPRAALGATGTGLVGAPSPSKDTRFATAPGGRSTPADVMAEAYHPTHRAQARQVFVEMLAGYRKIERQFDIPANDVAGAVAAFIAGSYMAYRNQNFPDQDFVPLVNQMRSIISSNPQFVRSGAAERQETYEQMAILGMFMATNQMALQQRPDPALQARMKDVAKGYLEQFLKVDAERVQITSAGLVLR